MVHHQLPKKISHNLLRKIAIGKSPNVGNKRYIGDVDKGIVKVCTAYGDGKTSRSYAEYDIKTRRLIPYHSWLEAY